MANIKRVGVPKVTVQPQQEQPIAVSRPIEESALDPSTGQNIKVIKNGSSGEAPVPQKTQPDPTVENCHNE